MRGAASWLSLAASLAAASCGPTFQRAGAPMQLASGEPRGPCEAARWVDVVPMTSRVREATALSSIDHEADGFALFARADGGGDALPMARALALVDDPALTRSHQGRIDDVRRREARARSVLLGSLAGMVAGQGLFLPGLYLHADSDARTPLLVSGAVVSAAGVVAAIVGFALLPSREEFIATAHRERMFIPEEDRLDDVRAGVDRHHARVRGACRAP